MSLCGWTYASFKSRVILCFHPPTRALLRSSRRRSCTAAPVGRAIHTLSGHIQKPNSDHEHFFRYTSGRWLWDEDQQLRDRYKAFNVAELQAAAAQAAGSSACIAMTKLAEGGYNKVFRLLMDDGKVVLARIPNPNAGPPFYTTASEVATMEFARDVLDIPTPRVLDWNPTSQNSVGSEYIILEEAPGTQLARVWDGMSPDAKLSVMREVVSLETKMLSCSFSHYGSIYFARDAVEGAVPAHVTGEISTQLKQHVSKTYTVGPTVDRQFWKRERATMDISRGPWPNPKEYAISLGQREVEWIEKHAVTKQPRDALLISQAQNDPQAHIQLLQKYLRIAPHLMEIDEPLTHSTLWHTDLHSANLFVKNGRVTAVIDWQGLWAGPLFLQSRPSPLVDYQGNMLLQRPDDFDGLEPDEQARVKLAISKSTLFQLYLLETATRNPSLAEVFHLDHGKTRCMPIEFAGNTWDEDIVPFRESLISVERRWRELGIHGECPYHFSQDDLTAHWNDAEGWNEVQDFFDGVQDLVRRDGWTHPETFDDALQFFADLRRHGLEHMQGEERARFENETRWINGGR